MSIHVMSAVYQARLGSTTRKAILLKMADHSNDDGGSIYVGVDRISREIEVADRTVQRALRKFETEGLLVVEKKGGNGPRSTTHYRIDLQRLAALPRANDPKGDNKSSKRKATKGDRVSPLPKTSRVTLATAKGDTDAKKGDTVSPEPSITINEPSKRQRGARARRSPKVDAGVVDAEFSDVDPAEAKPEKVNATAALQLVGEISTKPARAHPMTADWTPHAKDWARAIDALGSEEAARYQLEKFRDYWSEIGGAKGRKPAWDGTWRNWVRKTIEYASSHPQSRNDTRGHIGSLY